MKKSMKKAWRKVYENEAPPATPPAPPAAPPTKTFTQQELDKIVQDRIAAEKAKANKEMQAQLARIASLETDAAKKAELEQQIEELAKQNLTKEQLAAQEKAKAEQAWEKKFKEKEASELAWKKKYTDEKILRDIVDAASHKDFDVFNASQIVAQLQPGARLVEKLQKETGKPTGELETRVKFTTFKDGAPSELDLTPLEAVKAMKEDERFGNFFKSNIAGGTGSGPPRANGKPSDPRKMTQEEINERWRKGGVNGLGL